MNRLLSLTDLDPRTDAPHDQAIESGRYSPAFGEAACSIFAPLHYEPNYAYPLLVWLHGPHDDENQLRRIMPLVSMRNYVAVAPRGTLVRHKPEALRRRLDWRQTPAEIALAESRVFESVELATRQFNIAARRIYLAGFDTGGTMAFRLGLSHPETFAGVLSLCGAFPQGGAPLLQLTKVRDLGVLLASGINSSTYRPDDVCVDLRLLHSAGFDIMLRQYPCGQEISPHMLGDMDRWMMEQILGE